jgi:hypothetical protein
VCKRSSIRCGKVENDFCDDAVAVILSPRQTARDLSKVG